jgi:ankyrin repeat protein
MASSRRSLPAHADLGQQRTLAKELLAAFRSDDPDAISRIRAELPDKQRIVLADAQLVLAREYGFPNWSALRDEIATRSADIRAVPERFRRAVQHHDVEELRALRPFREALRSVVDEPSFAFDSPALVHVAGSGDVALIDALLALGADPNRRSDWWAGGFHALYSADGAVAERLLAAGAIPDACAAARIDRIDLLRSILAQDRSRVHERGGDGQTPLHFARSRAVVDLLLEAGADIDATDRDHRSTPAQWMLGDSRDPAKSRLEVARYLVERGASTDIFLAAALGLTNRVKELLTADPSLLALRTGHGAYAEKPPSSYHIYFWTIGQNMTPLHAAVHFGQHETVKVMQAFASPEQRLLLACFTGDAAEVRAIVAEHPGVVARLMEMHQSALAEAAWIANAAAVRLMLELGFDPGAISVSGGAGGTALHCAAWEGSPQCVEAILAYPSGRALIETLDTSFGATPLGWCCHGSLNCGDPRAKHVEVARLLLAAGARVDPNRRLEASDAVRAVIEGSAR